MKVLMNEEFKSEEIKLARKDAALNVLFSVLGPIGTAIQESLFGIGDRIRNSRIEKYLNILEPRIRKIESLIDFNTYKTIEFYDLNYKILKVVSDTSDELKHKILAEIFCTYLATKNEWDNDKESIFINITNEFSTNHLYVLKFLITRTEEYKIKSYETLHSDFCIYIKNNKIDVYLFRLYCRDIENRCLIRFSSNLLEIGSTGGFIEKEDSSKIPSILLTSLGEKFISLFNEKKISNSLSS